MFSTSVKEKNGGLDQEKLFSKMEKLYLSGMVVSLYVFRQTDFVSTGRNVKVEMEKIPEDSTSELRDGAQTKINDEISETMRCKNTDFQNVNMENGVVDPHESVQLKPKERIQYKIDLGSKEWIKATGLGREGKVTGRNKDWYNVENDENKERKSVDLGQLPWKKADTLEEVNVAVTADDPLKIAKIEELQKFRDFDTYEEVADEGQPTVSTHYREGRQSENSTCRKRL